MLFYVTVYVVKVLLYRVPAYILCVKALWQSDDGVRLGFQLISGRRDSKRRW